MQTATTSTGCMAAPTGFEPESEHGQCRDTEGSERGQNASTGLIADDLGGHARDGPGHREDTPAVELCHIYVKRPSGVPIVPRDLRTVIKAWPELPEPVRDAILEMVKATREDQHGPARKHSHC